MGLHMYGQSFHYLKWTVAGNLPSSGIHTLASTPVNTWAHNRTISVNYPFHTSLVRGGRLQLDKWLSFRLLDRKIKNMYQSGKIIYF